MVDSRQFTVDSADRIFDGQRLAVGSALNMRAHGDILLVSTYELGHPPHHLASTLGFLENAGFAAEAVDIAVDTLSDEQIARAKLVAIATPMHTALRLGLRVAERVRVLNPLAHVCFFGLYAILEQDLLLTRWADSVIGGEFESALIELAETLQAGRTPPPARTEIERLPFVTPSRARLPTLDRYAKLVTGEGEKLAGYVEASRGCLHRCRHCPIPPIYGGRFFAVPEAVVLADIRQQISVGARHLTFGDPDFFNGPMHGLRIARQLHREIPDVTFDVTIKVEHLLRHQKHLAELAALGCAFVTTAVESLSDRVLRLLDKGHSQADVHRVFALGRHAGLTLRPTLVPFTPWSTLEDYRSLLAWIEEENLYSALDPIQLAIRLLIPPGSKLLELEELTPHLGAFDEAQLGYRWIHPDSVMDELAATVFALVERDSAASAFDQIRELVSLPARADRRILSAPHISESWFC